jgi:hypothetical protein
MQQLTVNGNLMGRKITLAETIRVLALSGKSKHLWGNGFGGMQQRRKLFGTR